MKFRHRLSASERTARLPWRARGLHNLPQRSLRGPPAALIGRWSTRGQPHVMNNAVYIVPGRGNKLSDIGDKISRLGFDVYGREVLPPFSNRCFADQLRIIQKDLVSSFWDTGTNLVGHSYGGYLLLHSLSEIEPFPGKILLFSPVLGAAVDRKKLYVSRPPRADRLLQLAENNKFPIPRYLEIHTGENDDGCDPDLARRIGSSIPGSKISIVRNQGHTLASEYMDKVLSRFLNGANPAGPR